MARRRELAGIPPAGEPEDLSGAMLTGEEEEEGRNPHEEEALQDAEDAVSELEQLASGAKGFAEYWLYRAHPRNKTFHGSYLKRYDRNTPVEAIYDEARDQFGGGDFVLLVKVEKVIKSKHHFSTEKNVLAPNQPEGTTHLPAPAGQEPDPFARLGNAMEKALVVDRVSDLMARSAGARKGDGIDPTTALILQMMESSNRQMVAMIQAFAAMGNKAQTPGTDLIEALKLGVSIAQGKEVGGGEEEGGLMGLAKSFLPVVPAILAAGKGGAAPQPVHPQPGRALPPPPPPPPPAASPVVANPPPATRPLPPTVAAMGPEEQRRAIKVLNGIEEVVLGRDPAGFTEADVEWTCALVERYFAGLLNTLAEVPEESFWMMVNNFNPEWAAEGSAHRTLFTKVREYLMQEDEEVPAAPGEGEPNNE